MKIGLSFVGVSFGIGRNYNHCFPYTAAQIIEPFKRKHEVKTYITSYTSDKDNQDNVVELFQPTLYQFDEYKGSHQILTYIKSLEQLRNQDLDFVISTRFDIHYHQDVSEIKFDYNKFNALFKEKGWWENMHFTTDNLFAFPYSMLENFILALQGLYTTPARPGQMDMHQAFYRVQQLIGKGATNIVSSIDELSNTNIFYSLCSDKWGIK